MKRKVAGQTKSKTTAAGKAPGRIHPIIIYPFRHPEDFSDLEQLYGLVKKLDSQPSVYARPITVMDRKTHYSRTRDRKFHSFRDKVVSRYSEVLDSWSVDTCQMWYAGMGMAFERGGPRDVYWMIPGDFNYGSHVGQEVLGRLHDLPEICVELNQDVCIGEIETDHSNPKQLIDTYGTFALLYNWFPSEGRAIRQYTERPRSEFFAVRHSFLRELLSRRWYAYEQTVVMLLQALLSGRRISRFSVGNISDLPQRPESFASAVQQVERAERVMKSVWRERHEDRPGWRNEYRRLEAQSEQVLRTALIIFENLLR